MENEIVVQNNKDNYSVEAVVERVKAVSTLYSKVMQEGQHYGSFMGISKPTLLKAGAEKILAMFALSPKTDKMDIRDMGNGHREYIITISLINRKTGEYWGDGSGSCSTMEAKYRYREDYEEVGFVPKEYWDDRSNPQYAGLKAKKIDGVWKFLKGSGKIENPDIADVYNTVLKMAEKRALVSAVLKSTGVSDIFTQDVEDFDDLPNKKQSAPNPQNQAGEESQVNDFDDNKINFIDIEKETQGMNLKELVAYGNKILSDKSATPDIKAKISQMIADKRRA